MLQQTQVDRVIPFYKKFLKQFPTAKRLSGAPLGEVLKSWQGLGYNRRAKMLHAAAKEIAQQGMPRDVQTFMSLPGVGPYTARAVAAFAFNQDVVMIETNIRTALIHHFFPNKENIPDKDMERILAQALPQGMSRQWYSALMDYGAFLKRSGVSHNARGSAYVKQSAFTGSLREARGAILRELAKGVQSKKCLSRLCGDDRRMQLETALIALLAEQLIVRNRGGYALPS